MVLEKRIKKSSATVTGIVVTLLIIMGGFSAMFLYLDDQADKEGFTLDSKYGTAYDDISDSQDVLSNNVDGIIDSWNGIKEADNTYQVAVNGLKGLGNVLLLPILFVSSAVDTTTAILLPLDFIPKQLRNLIFIAISAVVILIILAKASGESKM